MTKFVVENLSSKAVRLGVEPWAALEVLEPEGRAVFEYTEPAEIAFSVLDETEICVSIVSDRIRVLANGKESIFEPPPGNW